MVVDSHIHHYPPEVYGNPDAWGKNRGEDYWLSCVSPKHGKSLQGWKSLDELIRDMDTAQVDKAVVMSWYWENHDTCIENTGWQVDLYNAFPDRFIPFAPFNANGGEAALGLLKRAFEEGCKGIGEINPPAQHYDYSHPILSAALELAKEFGVPVTFHVTDPTTHDYPGKIETPITSLVDLANKHPETNFIFAHLGGCEFLRREIDIPANVFFDTSASPLLYKRPKYEEFCSQFGSERLLFGSDYPLKVFPRKPSPPNFVDPINELKNSNLSTDDLDRILGKNAASLFRLK